MAKKTKKTNPFAAFAGKAAAPADSKAAAAGKAKAPDDSKATAAGKAKAPDDSKATAAAIVKKAKGQKAGQTAPAAEQAKPAAKRQFPSLAGRVDAAPAKPAANNFAKVLAAAKAKKKKAR